MFLADKSDCYNFNMLFPKTKSLLKKIKDKFLFFIEEQLHSTCIQSVHMRHRGLVGTNIHKAIHAYLDKHKKYKHGINQVDTL